MLGFEDVPPPQPLATVALLGLVCVLWVYARVQLLRRQLARGGAEQRGVTRLRFLHRLAAWRGTNALLLVLAAAFGALLWRSL